MEDDDKLPGTKPEMLIGKWEGLRDGGLFFDSHTYLTRYEITETGGFVVERYYDPVEKVFLEPDTINYFANWSYYINEEGQSTIYFISYQGKKWGKHIYGLTSDSILLGCNDCPYYKIKE
jgi:hypothetical protein